MKQSTKRIFAAALAALVVAAAGTTLTTQLPQLTNSVAHADTVKENDTAWAESGDCSEDKKMRWSLVAEATRSPFPSKRAAQES